MTVENRKRTFEDLQVQQDIYQALVRVSQWPDGAQSRIAHMALPEVPVQDTPLPVTICKTMAAALARIAQWPEGAQSNIAQSVMASYPELWVCNLNEV